MENTQEVKEILLKQLQLLSEESERAAEARDLYELSQAMVSIAAIIQSEAR